MNDMPHVVLQMLSEALSQYVENNENALVWFGHDPDLNPPDLRSKTELAKTVLDIIDAKIARAALS